MRASVRPTVEGLRRLIRKCHFLSQSNWGRQDGPILSMLRGQGRRALVTSASHGGTDHVRSYPNIRHWFALQYLSFWARTRLMRCNMFRRKIAEGLFFRHPGFAQALDNPGIRPVRGRGVTVGRRSNRPGICNFVANAAI
jgi:hypothetical protein